MNEQQIFEAALDCRDAAELRAYLDQACGADAALRTRVEALLASHAAASQFLQSPAWGKNYSPTIGLAPDQLDHVDDESAAPDLSILEPPTQPGSIGTLAHYKVLEVLGQGAFGVVLKAFDEKLHRLVAIKALHRELATTSPPRKRFLREARSVAAVKHENVVQVHSVEEQPLPYLVMEFVDGRTLQQKMDGAGPLEIAEVLHLGREIAAGLAAAHAQGLIHRDIKPGNILLESGPEQRVKITDFGLARTADDASMTRTGTIAGTPLYMSPEQAQGLALDARADLFSLGSVLYQATTGRAPFRAATTMAVLKRVTEETPRPIPQIIPEAPAWLCAIIAKLHAKNPDDRFQSAREVSELFARCEAEWKQHGRVTAADELLETVEPAQPSQRPAISRRWIAAAAVIMLCCLGLTEATGVTQVKSTVIRFFTPSGTLVIEIDDPTISVTVDGDELTITGAGVNEFRMKPGKHHVVAKKDGETLRQGFVTVTKNGRQVVRVHREDMAAAATDPDKSSEPPPVARAKEPATPPLAVAPFDAAQARAHQEAWAKHWGHPAFLVNQVGMEFALIPPGSFTMGAAEKEHADKVMFESDKHERPQHKVELTQPYLIGQHEVTQKQFQMILRRNPSAFAEGGRLADKVAEVETAQFPVESVTWFDAVEFCNALSTEEDLPPFYELKYLVRNERGTITAADVRELGGAGYRLPTEAEWEFACRAGTTEPFSFPFNYGTVAQYGWFGYESHRPHNVGDRKPNAFGLCDMHGNVLEFCHDWFGEYSADAAQDPRGAATGTERVVRGGTWNYLVQFSRSAWRSKIPPGGSLAELGFRVARNVPAGESSAASQEHLAERRAAEWVLSVGGFVDIRENGKMRKIRAGESLPESEFELVSVDVRGGKVNDEELRRFRRCRRLTYLIVQSPKVTDAGLANFRGCKLLNYLNLEGARLSDAGLEHFAGNDALTGLALPHTPLTDAAVDRLAKFTSLQGLNLKFTNLTEAGVKRLREALPQCKVEWDAGGELR